MCTLGSVQWGHCSNAEDWDWVVSQHAFSMRAAAVAVVCAPLLSCVCCSVMLHSLPGVQGVKCNSFAKTRHSLVVTQTIA
jgi:hypothetical protein